MKAKAGRDAGSQVGLALWCEAHGLTSERVKHLTKAVLGDPGNAAARGLLGLVAFHGKWERPEAVAEKVKADPALAAATAEYLQKRVRTAETADAQYKLALWCEENGLGAQAVAHLRRVVKLEPGREAAWKRLGYKKQANGRWAIPAQAAAEKAEAEAQKQANRLWTPRLEHWRTDLDGKLKAKRAAADAGLAGVTDPRAIPAVWSVFGRGDEARQAVALRLFRQIDAPAATQSIALLAVSGVTPEVRRRAAETLRSRDPRDFSMLLVGLMRKPVKYQYTPVRGPGQTGTLTVEGENVTTNRRYTPPQMPDLTNLANRGIPLSWGTDANGLPALFQNSVINGSRSQALSLGNGEFAVIGPDARRFLQGSTNAPAPSPSTLAARIAQNPSQAGQVLAGETRNGGYMFSRPGMFGVANTPDVAIEMGGYSNRQEFDVGRAFVESQQAAVSAERQLENDVQSLESYNVAAREANKQVADILNNATGETLEPDPVACRKWAVDQLGYALGAQTSAKPAVNQDVTLDYQLPPVAGLIRTTEGYASATSHHSCFGRGTLVHTQSGPEPIETVRAGDLVLVQDTKTGALSYKAVVIPYHNPPNATYKVALDGGETVVATGIHRFWKAGKGWTMARDLVAGDALRSVDGAETVVSVTADPNPQPVFNLEVADSPNFFVGGRGLLVHDNSLVVPEPEPFDAPPALTARGAR